MEVLCGYHKNLFIVGDPDQTIYTWRGANVKYLMDFDQTHESCKTIMMMENYRSTPEIIACANELISKNKFRIKKELVPTLAPAESLIKSAKSYAETKEKFLPENLDKMIIKGGTRIHHDIFGDGTVLDFDTEMNAHIVKFDMLDTVRKLNVKAKLEII